MSKLPLLLLDNNTMSTVINEGEFKISMLSFDEAKAIIEMYDSSLILRTFSNENFEQFIENYLSIKDKDIAYKKVANMRPGQDAIAFKLYITPSETQPITHTPLDTEAKKVQNVYISCQYISRVN